MFPRKFEHALFGFVLSGFMSCLVSGVSTFRAVGWPPHFVALWMSAWLSAWPVAFVAVLGAAPVARRVVQRMLRAEEPPLGGPAE